MILLDTHIVLWAAQTPERLSRAALDALDHAAEVSEALAIADITLREIAMMSRKQQVIVKAALTGFLQECEDRFFVLPITPLIAQQSIQFSSIYPNDPVDQLIGATAIIYGCKLITADRKILSSGEVDCIW